MAMALTHQRTAVITGLTRILAFQRRGIRWSNKLAAFIWNANGLPVSLSRISRELDLLVDRYSDNFDNLSDRLAEGRLSIPEWQARMRREIKDLHKAQYIIGRGGRDKMTPSDWGRLGADLRWTHYDALDNFALQIADGDLTEAQIRARARLYANSSNKQYWRGTTTAKIQAGYTMERRVLNPAEHCGDCRDYEAMGKQPIGTLPEPGEQSVCGPNCKCSKEYYKE